MNICSWKFLILLDLFAKICILQWQLYKICMNQKLDLNNEIVFASSDQEMSHAISRLTKEGRLKKIAPRLYTTNLIDSPERIFYVFARNPNNGESRP